MDITECGEIRKIFGFTSYLEPWHTAYQQSIVILERPYFIGLVWSALLKSLDSIETLYDDRIHVVVLSLFL